MPFQTAVQRLRHAPLFWGPALGVLGLCLAGWAGGPRFTLAVAGVNDWIFDHFGGFYLSFAGLALAALVGLAVSPIGRWRLGGPDARPEYRFATWFAMLFCAGMGTGFLFWGAAEPLVHFVQPPAMGAAAPDLVQALQWTFFHWGLHPWAIYGLTALAIGYRGFNLAQGFHLGLGFQAGPQRPSRRLGADLITLTAILVGVAATLGMGVLQLGQGLHQLAGWPDTPLTQAGLLLAVTVAYLASTLLGLDRGIKILSQANLWLCLLMLAWVLALMPPAGAGQPSLSLAGAADLWRPFGQALGAYLQRLPEMTAGIGPPADWVRDWTVKYWTWWIAWAPFVGLFIAHISRGRTLRQLAVGVLVAPTLLSCLWFTVFGAAAIRLQQAEHLFGATFSLAQADGVLFQLLGRLSAEPVLPWLTLALVAINFINSADSATLTVAKLSSPQPDKAPVWLQVGWGLLFALLAGLLLLTGGIGLLQQVTLVAVLPFTLLLSGVFLNLFWALARSARAQPGGAPVRSEALAVGPAVNPVEAL